MKKLLWASLGLAVFLGPVSQGAQRLVPAQYRSIQQAIDDCNDGDTVVVSPGVYYETINFGGRNIVVTSRDPNDPKVVGYTIINADGDGTVVTFENGESSRAVLTGFTITGGIGTADAGSGGSYTWLYGAGILCRWGSPTITRNVITNNHGPYVDEQVGDTWRYVVSYGGGIYCNGGATITHNVIYNNSAYEGGGICGSGRVANNIIYGNSAGYGGGVYLSYGSLENNTIVGNDCSMAPDYGYGGNVYVWLDYQSAMLVRNNIVCEAGSGGGIYYGGSLRGDMIRFNDVWNNAPADYGLQDPRTYESIYGPAADLTGQFGNISADPLFLDPWNHNFHVQSMSPCVSAGDPNFVAAPGDKDIDQEPRVFALRVDIGADEHVGYVKPLANAGRDQHFLTPGAVTLDGRDSYFADPCGVRTWQWSQTDGPAVELSGAATAQPTFTPAAEGWYTFALVVGDGQYTSGPDKVLVVVGNQRPVADAGPDGVFPIPGYVALNGLKSHDADPPDELSYTWTQLEGPSVVLQEPNSATPYFSCDEEEIYVFQLVVRDGFVASEPDTVKVETSRFTVTVQDSLVTDYDQGYFFYPDGAGSTIVYTGAREYDTQAWAIQCLDTETGRLDTFDGSAIDTMPKTDGNHVVWAGSGGRYAPLCTGLFLGDLVTGGLQYLRIESATESYSYPALSGNRVVWAYFPQVGTNDPAQYQASFYSICGADITDPARPVFFTVAEKVGQREPYPYSTDYTNDHEDIVDVCGNLVVWEGNGDIFGADISDLDHIKVFPICTAPQRQYDPSISGHVVVWTDERNDVGDIYGADISDPDHIREFEVAVAPGWQLQADIDGPFIAYLDGDDYYGNIGACCLTREYGAVHFPFGASYPEIGYVRPFYGSGPRVDGSTVTWQEGQRIRQASFDFAYGVTAGPVQNLTTGRHYDYIQHAIDAASAGDVIVVQPGTYYEKLRFKGKNVAVQSTDPQDPAVRAAAILTGSGQCATFMDDETADCSLAGFTITGGSFGVVCSGASPTISDCTIVNQAAAGVKVWNKGNPTFRHCEIAGNGRGVEMWAKRDKRVVLQNAGTFQNCLVVGSRGAGFYGGNPILENCTIADNAGAGVDVYSAQITDSIIYFNRAGAANVRIENAKSPVTYSDVQGGWAGTGNIDQDPLFVMRGLWSGPIQRADSIWRTGDYHLQSEGWTWSTQGQDWTWFDATSPCIDMGDPNVPLGAEPVCEQDSPLCERAGTNWRINMGAYGGTPEASLVPREWFSAGGTTP
jgi:beta propeller repeat protein